MSKRTIVRSQWYYNEQFPNLIAINHKDMDASKSKSQINMDRIYLISLLHTSFLEVLLLSPIINKKYTV